jgi:hypothetical protein
VFTTQANQQRLKNDLLSREENGKERYGIVVAKRGFLLKFPQRFQKLVT